MRPSLELEQVLRLGSILAHARIRLYAEPPTSDGALAPEHSEAIVPGGNGMFKPTIVVDGEVVGTWTRTLRAREIIIEAVPFARLPGTVHEGLAKAVEAYGAFTGRPARLAKAAGS